MIYFLEKKRLLSKYYVMILQSLVQLLFPFIMIITKLNIYYLCRCYCCCCRPFDLAGVVFSRICSFIDYRHILLSINVDVIFQKLLLYYFYN